MCGRFSRTSPAEVIVEEFGVRSVATGDLAPRYNVCPGDRVAAIVDGPDGRRLGALHWGLGARAQINVRSETVARHPAFREAFARRRCLVVADGFYEWLREASGKTPHYFRLASGKPFAFAGIWSRPDATDGSPATAILTCPANEIVSPVHDRMPVMLTGEACGRWLGDGDVGLLRPFPAAAMESYAVSSLVNSARNDSPECLRPAGRTLRLVPRPE